MTTETIFQTNGLTVTTEEGKYGNLIVTFDFNQEEAKGKIVVETGSYGLWLLAPDVLGEAFALVDLFYNSECGKDYEHGVPLQVIFHSPQVSDDAMGRIRYLPTHAYVDFELGVVNLNDEYKLHKAQFGYPPEEENNNNGN